jgi:hypothetical protein
MYFGFSIIGQRTYAPGQVYSQAKGTADATGTRINYGVGGAGRDWDSPQNFIDIHPFLRIDGFAESQTSVDGVSISHEVVLVGTPTFRFVCRIRIRNTNNEDRAFAVAVWGDVQLCNSGGWDDSKVVGDNLVFEQKGAKLCMYMGRERHGVRAVQHGASWCGSIPGGGEVGPGYNGADERGRELRDELDGQSRAGRWRVPAFGVRREPKQRRAGHER